MSAGHLIVIHPDGTVVGMWSDDVPWEELGRVSARRVSAVEFDEALQEWAATDLRTGRVIARGNRRGEVLAAELAYYQALLEGGEEV